MARLLLIFVTLYSLSTPAYAIEDKDRSYAIEADVVEYDQEKKIITAKGNIEIVRDEYTLKAEQIKYDETTKKAFASGNVTLISPNGNIITAQEAEIDNSIKEAIANFAKATIDRENTFTAKKIKSYYPNIIVFEKVTYTPCSVCEDKKPQWQVKSSRIHYEKEKNTSYYNNIFEVYGIPVFYFPYFMSASPDSPPRSGFLFPNNQKYNNIFGYGITTPFYLRVADDKDLLYSPIITTKQGVLHQAKFAHLLEKGKYSIGGNYISATQNKSPIDPADRFHALADLDYDLNDKWNLNGKIDRVSDKSYLHNYWDTSPNYLTSNASLNYLSGHNFGSIENYSFQGLRSGDSIATDSKLLPSINYHHETESKAGIISLDANTVNIQRNRGVNSRRISGKAGIEKTYYYKYQELSILPNFKFDIYNFQHKMSATQDSAVADTRKNAARTIPELELVWKMPFVNNSLGSNSMHLEPIVNLILSPNNSHNDEIINEDSQEVELSDTNLFSTNRYSGFDRVEQGIRTNYGVRLSGIVGTDKEYHFLIGQSYRIKKDPDYYVNSGLWNKSFSDYVTRLSVKPHKTTEFYYRNRIDSQNAVLRRNEAGVDFNFHPTQMLHQILINVHYIRYNLLFPYPNQATQLMNTSTKLFLNKEWYLGGELKRSGTTSGTYPVSTKFSLGYAGECADIKISAFKDYTQDPSRNLKSTNGFTLDLDVQLKNITN